MGIQNAIGDTNQQLSVKTFRKKPTRLGNDTNNVQLYN